MASALIAIVTLAAVSCLDGPAAFVQIAAAQPIAVAQRDAGNDLVECRDSNADADRRAKACGRVAETEPAVTAAKLRYQAAIMAALARCLHVGQGPRACGRIAVNDPAVKAAMDKVRAVLRQRVIALLTAGAAPRASAPSAPARSSESPADLAECKKEAGGKDVPRALDVCTRVIAANPGNNAVLANAYLMRVSLYARLRQFDRMVADCDEVLRIAPRGPLSSIADIFRGVGLTQLHEFDRALADFDKAVTPSNPLLAEAYEGRGNLHLKMGHYERARADIDKAISLKPGLSAAYAIRAQYHLEQNDSADALADVNEGLRLDPKNADLYVARAEYYLQTGKLTEAQADADRVLGLAPGAAGAHAIRGRIALAQGRIEVALGELTEAIDGDGREPDVVAERGVAYERAGRADRALADYRRALQLTPSSRLGREAQENARKRIAALANAPAAPPAVAVPTAPPGRRIALVIGMSAYVNVPPLRNPANDARAIAAEFRRLGFAEVIEREDLTRDQLEEALKDFGDKAEEADWAIIYYAGHGLEMNGVNYLIPVDAKLDRADHVEDETVSLTRVLSKAEPARKLRMVILDACRNNPFRMATSGGRSRGISRGLSPVEPARGELVVYAARDGTTADDGDSGHSPFTRALLANLETPNLDIRIMFSRVRDQVLASTNNAQEPFTYGSLPGQEFFFKQAGR